MWIDEGTAEQPRRWSPGYVDRDGVSLLHFVNRYIRTRRRSVNSENRKIVREAIGSYRGSFPARCAELEAFLDSTLQVASTRPVNAAGVPA